GPAVTGAVVGDPVGAGAGVDLLVRPRLKRQPGVPCRLRIGKPSGSPHVAYASVRPSGVSSLRSGSPTGRAYVAYRFRLASVGIFSGAQVEPPSCVRYSVSLRVQFARVPAHVDTVAQPVAAEANETASSSKPGAVSGRPPVATFRTRLPSTRSTTRLPP